MGTRHPNPGLIKLNYSYQLDEIARCCNVHRNTVRSWLRQGLPTIDNRRPLMVRGPALRAFLARRRNDAKAPCPLGHFYCLKCRAPRMPAGGMADYIVREGAAGNLRGICPTCERWMFRRLGLSHLDEWRSVLDITVTLRE